MGQKAEVFAEYAKSIGWKAELTEDGARATVVAKRDGYKLSISWNGEACLNETYLEYDGAVRKIRNAGAAKRKMEELAGETTGAAQSNPPKGKGRTTAGKPSATTTARRRAKPEPVEPIETKPRLQKRLPFDLETAEDKQILEAVVGRRIIWRNVLASRYEEARVMDRPNQRHLRIERNRKNERCLTWAAEGDGGIGEDHRGPFRSVKLTSIVQIVK